MGEMRKKVRLGVYRILLVAIEIYTILIKVIYIIYYRMLYFILNLVKLWTGINTGLCLIRMGCDMIICGVKLLIT